MKVDNCSISRFLSHDMTYMIPVYQRNYDWQNAQCKQLVLDIENIVGTNENHFIGTVCIKIETRENCVIIDGQQRITTILLLFKVIHDLTNDLQLKKKIQTRFLIDEFSRNSVKLKLKPIKKDETVFRKLIENENFDEKNFDTQEKLSNVYCNFVYMKELLSKSVSDGLYTIEDFEDAVERLEIVELDLERENPQIIFESLNSTGLDLTDSDLLRNYLLMSLDYKDQVYLYEKYWREIETNCNNDNRILEDFMTYFLITKKRSNSTMFKGKKAQINNNKLYYSFKRDYPKIDRSNMVEVENCFKELLQFSVYYSHFIFDESTVRENLSPLDKYFYDLVFLLNGKDSVIVLLYLSDKYKEGYIDGSTYINAIKALISLQLRASVCDKNGLSKQFSAAIIQKLDTLKSSTIGLKEFWNVLNTGSGSYSFPRNTEFEFALKTKPIYSELRSRKVKYLLYALEEFKNPKETHVYADGSIEHICPQTLSLDWKNYLTSKKDMQNYETHLHLLGNLSLTGFNSEIGNLSFDKKKKEYAKSNYLNTREISNYSDWTSQEIDQRGEELIKDCLKIWNLPDEYNKQSLVSVGVSYDLDSDFNMFTHTKPAEVSFLGGNVIVTSWSELVISVLTDCYDFDKQVFGMLLTYKGFDGNKVYFNTNAVNMNNASDISNSGIYVDVGNSTIANLRLIQKVLEFYDSKLGTDFVHELSFVLGKV